jgi:hypothetical protein
MEQIKERPILFSAPMVRAILEENKTQTRRVVKLPSWSSQNWDDFDIDDEPQVICAKTGCFSSIPSPYGKVGDRIWVKETWRTIGDAPLSQCIDSGDVSYRADADDVDYGLFKWRPSIFMFRWASRITLEITNVSVERVQDISEEDAIAEGIYKMSSGYWSGGVHPVKGTPKHLPTAKEGFQDLWDSINGKKFPWDSNPWVWVIQFKISEVKKHGS